METANQISFLFSPRHLEGLTEYVDQRKVLRSPDCLAFTSRFPNPLHIKPVLYIQDVDGNRWVVERSHFRIL
ncbi:hypothetical protein XENTR_v10009753 [Xenopus tropicalis]|nr:hypothetical protein XENTR_v10009753 [Xenopus tropicalis]